jgi:hypothetical protein
MNSDREIADFWYNELIEGLRLIASEFTVQENSLPDFVHLPDEVLNAVQLDTLGLVVKFKLISNEQLQKLKELDTALDEITLPSDYSEMIELMKNGDSFETLRGKALHVLQNLNCEYLEPKINATYVKGS